MAEITNPHDRFFKEMLSQQDAATDFLRYYLPADVVALLDLNELILLKDSFVDETLQEHFSDLLYQVKLRSGLKAYVYVLFEHKSYSDPMVGFQLLRYLVRVWDYALHQGQPLRPILPVVVYHGAAKWSVPETFHEMLEMPECLKPFVPDYRYWLCDLSRYTDEELRGGVLLQVALLTMKYIFRSELSERLPEILGLLRGLTSEHGGLAYLRVLLRYVAGAGEHVTESVLHESVERVFCEEGGGTVSTIAQRWIEQGLQQGLQQGLEEGLQRGILEEAREMLLGAVEVKFGMVPAEMEGQVNRIASRRTLRSLHDQAIRSETLEQFRETLQRAVESLS